MLQKDGHHTTHYVASGFDKCALTHARTTTKCVCGSSDRAAAGYPLSERVNGAMIFACGVIHVVIKHAKVLAVSECGARMHITTNTYTHSRKKTRLAITGKI